MYIKITTVYPNYHTYCGIKPIGKTEISRRKHKVHNILKPNLLGNFNFENKKEIANYIKILRIRNLIQARNT